MRATILHEYRDRLTLLSNPIRWKQWRNNRPRRPRWRGGRHFEDLLKELANLCLI